MPCFSSHSLCRAKVPLSADPHLLPHTVLPLPAVQTSSHMKDIAWVLFEASCRARFQGALILVSLPQ